MTPLPTIASIQKAVARSSRVRLASLRDPAHQWPRGKSRNRTCAARQLSMCLSARLCDLSLNRIGHFHGRRDHSTVIHACRQVEKRCRRDRRLRNRLRRITLELVRR